MIFYFFVVVIVSKVFFRAQSLPQILNIFEAIFTNCTITGETFSLIGKTVWFILPGVLYEIFEYKNDDVMTIFSWPKGARRAVLLAFFSLILFSAVLGPNAGSGGGREFVYFQF